MSTRRPALGRGLDALLPGAVSPSAASRPRPATEPPQRDAPDEAHGGADARAGVERIAVSRIRPNPEQPRRRFDPEALASLAGSLERHGVLQPVVVRRVAADGSGVAPDAGEALAYELVVGERRWRAAQQAGLETIPATVQDVAPRDLLELALVENVQRRDLNAIELAQAFRALVEAGLTQEQVGQRVGLDRSTVANHLRLLDLDRTLQADVEQGVLGAGHAKALLQLKLPERRRHLRDRIVSGGLSVRAAEELARTLEGTRKPSRRKRTPEAEGVDPNLRHLMDSLRDALQTRVRITGTPTRGKIEVEFYGPEELNRISRAILEGPDGR